MAGECVPPETGESCACDTQCGDGYVCTERGDCFVDLSKWSIAAPKVLGQAGAAEADAYSIVCASQADCEAVMGASTDCRQVLCGWGGYCLTSYPSGNTCMAQADVCAGDSSLYGSCDGACTCAVASTHPLCGCAAACPKPECDPVICGARYECVVPTCSADNECSIAAAQAGTPCSLTNYGGADLGRGLCDGAGSCMTTN